MWGQWGGREGRRQIIQPLPFHAGESARSIAVARSIRRLVQKRGHPTKRFRFELVTEIRISSFLVVRAPVWWWPR